MAKRKSQTKKKTKWNKYLSINWEIIWILLISEILSIILHNAIYALFGFEEAVFFIIATIIIPLYLLTSIVYSLIKHKK